MIKVSPVSFLSSQIARTTQLERIGRELGAAQKELASGQLDDVGLSLGRRTAEVATIRQELARLEATRGTNGMVATRMSSAQAALGTIASDAEALLEALVAARNDPSQRAVVMRQAQLGLSAMIDLLGTSVSGAHVFSGLNVDRAPLKDYFSDPPPSSRTAVEAAFVGAFGFPPNDPMAATIDASSMQAFLDSDFEALFDAGWSTNWSEASGEPVASRITADLIVETSVSADEQALRKLTSVYVMVADLGVIGLNEAASQALMDHAIQRVAEAGTGIVELRGRLGSAQGIVADANDRIDAGLALFEGRLGRLEDADMSELSARIAGLIDQMEAAYTITARLQQLSLLNEL